MKKITLGISPCPNDTFIFDAMIHQKIDTKGLEFLVEYHDVEELNMKAFDGHYDVTKLSYHAFLYLLDHYQSLHSGSALGSGVGPLLVTNSTQKITDWKSTSVAIPGKYTTANFLLSIAFPEIQNKVVMEFSEIESAVMVGKVDAGLIIHEGRFTYAQKGLIKVMDMGLFWERQTSNLIPLGGIASKRTLDKPTSETINQLIRSSIKYAFKDRESSRDFVKLHAQEMDDTVIDQHIDLYVNKYSLDLGANGLAAIERMKREAIQNHLIPNTQKEMFL